MLTERLPLVGEVSANFCGFLHRSRYFFFQPDSSFEWHLRFKAGQLYCITINLIFGLLD
jgi:hypothetical protein